MKILFLTPRLLYPVNRGDKVRPYGFAKELAKHHELSLISFIQRDEERAYLGNLKDIFCRIEVVPLRSWQSNLNMLLRLPSITPLVVCGWRSGAMQRKVQQILGENKFDVIYVYGLRMAQYTCKIKQSYRILDLCDSLSLFLKRMLHHARFYLKPIFLREWLTLKRYEPYVAKQFDECWFISSMDRDSIPALVANPRVFIIPNGVDTDHFAPDPVPSAPKDIVFVGYMGVESVDAVTFFYHQVFPKVRYEVPEAHFRIVGANPPRQVRQLAGDSSISVEGFVEDLPAVYHQAAVAVAPMRFSVGMQNKVLEAMATEIPVVTTAQCNEGIGATHGKELFVCDNAEEFTATLIRLLRDGDLRHRVGSEARAFVQRRFTWSKVVDRIEQVSMLIGAPK